MSRAEYLKNWRLKNPIKAERIRLAAYAKRKERFPYIKKDKKKRRSRLINGCKRHDRLRLCTPKWLSEEQQKQINKIYDNARKLREIHGLDVQVDHIIPIKGKNVSGLHVPWNLRIIKTELNRLKANNLCDLLN
jgi:5-methylcytosine-specific restriction endonuclease McrA